MECSDIPALGKFARFVAEYPDEEVVQTSYRMVMDIIGPAPKPLSAFEMGMDPGQMLKLKESCEAVEKATRVIWACAAATDQIDPPMWDEIPAFDSAFEYFNTLPPIELMAATKEYVIIWEKRNIL
jgi:hypothetical protein